MAKLLAYSITVSVILIVMLAIYRAVMSRTTHFNFNRAILLAIYAVALSSFPLSSLLSSTDGISIGNIAATTLPTTDIADETAEKAGSFPWLTYVLWLYMAGVALMSIRLFTAAIGLFLLIACNKRQQCGRYTLVLHNRPRLVPFSWCRWIVIRREDYDETSEITIAHETAHLEQRHWIDLLIAESTLIFTWYNPASWMLRDELQSIHEFAADNSVIAKGFDARQYQLFLIKKTVGTSFHALANSLNHSSLKKRITMMLSKKSRGKARMRALALVPAVALTAVLVNNPAVASALGTIAATPTSVETSIDKGTQISPKADEKVYDQAEKLPEFPGGTGELMKFISSNIRWPEGADKSQKGYVVVRFTITSTGKVTDTRIMRNNLGDAFGKEAIRVMEICPDFIPGEIDGKPVAVNFTLPIRFGAAK